MTAPIVEEMSTGERVDTAESPREAAAELPVAVEPSHHVHLLGRSVVGPFAHTDDDGGPLLELYELKPVIDRLNRRNVSPAWIGLVPADTNRAQLVDEPDLGPRLYRLVVRGADGKPITQGDVDLRPPDDYREVPARGLLRGRRRRRSEPAAPVAPKPVESPQMVERLLARIEAMDEAHRSELESERRARAEAVEATHRQYARQIEALRSEHRAAVEASEARATQMIATLRDELTVARRALDAKREEVQGLRLDLVRAEVAAKTAPQPSSELLDIVQAAQKRQREIEQLRDVLGGQAQQPEAEPPSIKATVTDTLDSLQELTTRITTWGQLLGG